MSRAGDILNEQSGITIRPTTPGDGPQIVELLNQIYGNWGDLAYWQWKYLQPPVSYRLESFIATQSDGTAIGFFGANPVDVHFQGMIVRGAQTVDAAVLPQYRRHGIHSTLGKRTLDSAASENVAFIYAFPGIYSLKVNQRIGYEAVMFIPEMSKTIQPGKATMRWLRRLPGALISFWRWRFKGDWSAETVASLAELRLSLLMAASWVCAPTWGHRLPVTRQAVQYLNSFGEEFDYFDQQNQPVLGLVKNARYLNWRYFQHPRQKYHCLGVYAGALLLGYCVVRLVQETAKICELECTPGDTATLQALLVEAQMLAKQAGCSVLSIWQNSSSTKQAILRRMGFISPFKLHQLGSRRPKLAAQLYQVILYAAHLHQDQKQSITRSVAELSLSMGDSDLV